MVGRAMVLYVLGGEAAYRCRTDNSQQSDFLSFGNIFVPHLVPHLGGCPLCENHTLVAV